MMISWAPNRMSGRSPTMLVIGASLLSWTYTAAGGEVAAYDPITTLCTTGQYVTALATTGQYQSALATTGQYVNEISTTGGIAEC